jgi:hypothetical protein
LPYFFLKPIQKNEEKNQAPKEAEKRTLLKETKLRSVKSTH